MNHLAKLRLLSLFILVLSASSVLAADTEPPLGLPLISPTATATQTQQVTTYSTLTPTYTVSLVSTQEAVDEAETGPSIAILAVLSLVAGIGFFLIKKYFDLKRYSL